MKTDPRTKSELLRELKQVRVRLEEAEETLSAIRNGEVDALVVSGRRGDQIYTLKDANRPYRMMIERMNQGAVIVTPDGAILFSNAPFASLVQVPLETVTGSSIREYVLPAHQRTLEAILEKSRKRNSQGEIDLRRGLDLLPVLMSAGFLNMDETEVICVLFTDLSEQKQREKILASERLARAILDQAAEAIVICDAKGRITEASEEAHRLTGERILFKSFDEIFPIQFHSQDPPGWKPFSISGVLNGMFFRGAEVTLGPPENTFFLLNARPLFDKGNNVLGCVVTLTDISDRKRVEENLRETNREVSRSRVTLEETVRERTDELVKTNEELHQENVERRRAEWALQRTNELLERVFSSIDIHIAYMDKDFNFIRVNRAYAEADGHDPEFFVGRNHFELYPDPDNERIFRKVMETGEPFIAFEKPFVYAHHQERGVTYWDWSFQAVREPDGRVDGAVLSLIDVTPRLRAETEARDERAFRNSIQECMIDGILTTARDGEITYVNPAFCRLVGWKAEELLGVRPPYPFWASAEAETYNQSQPQIFRGKTPLPAIERRYQKRSGETFDVSILPSPLKNSAGRQLGWVTSIIDITERKRMEKTLQESQKLLRYLSAQLLTAQENERKKVARELHDSIGACLSAIKYGVESSLHQIADAGKNACFRAKSMEALIPMVQQCIEEVRRMQTDLRPSILDDLGILPTIGWFCREFEKIYAAIRTEKHLQIQEAEIPEDLKLVIYRLMQEGLNNVAKHSRADRVELSLRKNEDGLEFLIRDNGKGFAPEEGISEKNSGSGIGLPSMRERTELSGGSFFVESRVGKGTLIRARWPVK